MAYGVTQKLATQTFEGVDQFKWARICDKVKQLSGIDMSINMGSATAPAEASAKGLTISWVYSSTDKRLVIDLIKRSWFDPSVADIEERIAAWIQSA
jgi:hypothetical protein